MSVDQVIGSLLTSFGTYELRRASLTRRQRFQRRAVKVESSISRLFRQRHYARSLEDENSLTKENRREAVRRRGSYLCSKA